MLTVVMYHYVRDVARTRFPNMKALHPDDFSGQLDYFTSHYTVIRPSELFDAIALRKSLPANALMLTFDDGYTEHFDVVRPALKARAMSGAFFPIGSVLRERKLPNFNKVHLILGLGSDIGMLNEKLAEAIDRDRSAYGLLSLAEYRKSYAHANHLDDAEVLFFKRMMQVGLPEPARSLILNDIFREVVREDDDTALRSLYMDFDQLEEMIADGMYVGCHSYGHHWMDSLIPDEQKKDVDLAVDVLRRVSNCDPTRMFCFPYGGFNDALLDVLRSRSFLAAVTVEVRLADIEVDNPLLLPRLDTVHLPFRGDALVHDWTRRAAGSGTTLENVSS
jgi:peptidoglycan/xylan/chitin deacetylase (PgdA/CDA1 family)